MKLSAAARSGIIGGLINVAVILLGLYVPAFTYARSASMLVLFAAIIIGIKQTFDRLDPEAITYRVGIKAGAVSAVLVTLIMGTAAFVVEQSTPIEKRVEYLEDSYKAYFSQYPVTDTTTASFKKAVASADSAISANNYAAAKMYLEKAKRIKPSEEKNLSGKLNTVNEKTVEYFYSVGFQLAQLFRSFILPLLMGLILGGLTTLIWKGRRKPIQ